MVKSGANYLKEKELKSYIRTKFEEMEVLIPKGWHDYLKRRYGNYMELPPSEQQKGHHSLNIPDPFTPCNHSASLQWKERKVLNNQ